jgi:hypothetical protein
MSLESDMASMVKDAREVFGPEGKSLLITFNSFEYKAVQASDAAGNLLAIGAVWDQHSFFLELLKSEIIGPQPKQGDLIAVEGRNFRVASVTTSAGDPCLRIECEAPDGKAR